MLEEIHLTHLSKVGIKDIFQQLPTRDRGLLLIQQSWLRFLLYDHKHRDHHFELENENKRECGYEISVGECASHDLGNHRGIFEHLYVFVNYRCKN